MTHRHNAAIVLETVLLENGDSPRSSFGDREGWGAKMSDWRIGYFRENIVGHPQIQMKRCGGMLMDHSVPIGMGTNDMSILDGTTY
jgi:hypothetical protein